MTDIPLISGTTLPLDISLVNDTTPAVAIDLTTILEIVWEVFDGNRVVIRKSYIDDDITITGDPVDGEIQITLEADDTSPAFGVGSTTEIMTYDYETRLYFADGTQEVAPIGSVIISPSRSWNADHALVSGDARTVIVQGRY